MDDAERLRMEQARDSMASLVALFEPGALMTKGIAVMEVVSADGTKAVWTATTPDMMTYEMLGMLRYAQVLEESFYAQDEES